MNSSTKVSLIAAAVATAIGSSAYALPPSAWTSTTNPITVFYAGGGSAEVQAVYVAVSKLLVTSSIDVYTDGTGSTKHPQSLNYLVISGSAINAGTGYAAGAPIGFIYKYNGGSFNNGIVPFVTGQTASLNYPTLASIGSAAGAPTGYTGSNPTSLNPDYQFTATLGNTQTPAWGISDEEPGLFTYPWNLNGSTVTSTAGLTAIPAYVAPFGVAVTANLYAQKKKWSSAEIAAIFQGPPGTAGISAWNQIVGDNGSALTVAGQVNILDRGSGSGSKAAGNLFFFNYPESTTRFGGIASPYSVSGTNVNRTTGTVLVTSGTATNGFQDIKEGSSVAVVADLNAAQAAGQGAIAVLGLEFSPVFEQTTTGTDSYNFVALNGTYPDSETGDDNINNPATSGSTRYSNIVNGTYTFAFQTSFNYKTVPAGFQALVQQNLLSETIASANTGTAFPAATSGVLIDPAGLSTDPGVVDWTRNAVSTNAPTFLQIVSGANADPLN